MQTSGRKGRNESCRLWVSLGEAKSIELVIMHQSAETEQLKSPELKGTTSTVIQSRSKGRALKFLLRRPSLELGGSISDSERI